MPHAFKNIALMASGVLVTACSLEGINEAKSACIAEVKSKLDIDISSAPSGWSSYAGTGGKGTTFTFNQTATTPAIVCNTANGKVVSLTKSATTQIQ